jgi:hypothetical protein
VSNWNSNLFRLFVPHVNFSSAASRNPSFRLFRSAFPSQLNYLSVLASKAVVSTRDFRICILASSAAEENRIARIYGIIAPEINPDFRAEFEAADMFSPAVKSVSLRTLTGTQSFLCWPLNPPSFQKRFRVLLAFWQRTSMFASNYLSFVSKAIMIGLFARECVIALGYSSESSWSQERYPTTRCRTRRQGQLDCKCVNKSHHLQWLRIGVTPENEYLANDLSVTNPCDTARTGRDRNPKIHNIRCIRQNDMPALVIEPVHGSSYVRRYVPSKVR